MIATPNATYTLLKQLRLTLRCISSISPLNFKSCKFHRNDLHPKSLTQQSFRGVHSSSSLYNPRFKLKIDKDPDPLVPALGKDADQRQLGQGEGKEPRSEGAEQEGSYMKSHPYRKLNPWKSKSELAAYLVDNMIFDEHDLFVVNKPFGVPVMRIINKGKNQLHLRGLDISEYSLEELVPELRYLLKRPELVLCKSTERLTSGIAVFANDEKARDRFSKGIISSKGYYHTTYNYHIVTTLTPFIADPEKVEHLGMTIKKSLETEAGQPVLIKGYSKNSVKRNDVKPVHASTNVKSPGYHGGCLVEVRAGGTQNNFLRVHCADKLAPVLGDHLYSSRVRILAGVPVRINFNHLVPGSGYQLLSKKMLELLQLKRPEDSVMVPAHIHLRSYKVYKYLGKGMEIEFEAPYPEYFKWTCSSLGITLDPDKLKIQA